MGLATRVLRGEQKSAPRGARTPDPGLIRPMLYQLSYQSGSGATRVGARKQILRLASTTKKKKSEIAETGNRTQASAATTRGTAIILSRRSEQVGAPGTNSTKKYTLDGIRTRNPQIRSLMRYPLRHERISQTALLGENK